MQNGTFGKSVNVTIVGVVVFALTAGVFSGPWLYEEAGHLAFGRERDVLMQVTYPVKRFSEVMRLDVFRRSVENSIGHWLNTKKKER